MAIGTIRTPQNGIVAPKLLAAWELRMVWEVSINMIQCNMKNIAFGLNLFTLIPHKIVWGSCF